MSYVQIIEFVTRQPDEMKALGDKYIADTEGKRTATRSTIYMDQAEPHRYIAVVEFPGRFEAMENDNLPETEDFAEQLAELCDGPLTYRNFELVHAFIK
ncbi:MAG: hypothetical protein QOJ69_1939 [Actinomycetota bacterium]|jgi:hypothetical protein|nr:hypothetical protein [Actinomycetota bacterium]MEA2844268.1 hypothetical protein [Actinomycetota bacterium]